MNTTAELKRDISNWDKTAMLIYKTEDQAVLLEILKAEVRHYNRPYNRKRIYQRYSKVRRNSELKDLQVFLKNVEYDSKLLNYLTNQYTLKAHIQALKADLKSLLELLVVEIKNKNRPYIVKLLYGRFQTVRQKEEITLYA